DIRFENIQDGDEFAQFGSMTLLGISNEGPAGVLRPGEIGQIRLRGTAPRQTGNINIKARPVVDDGKPIDYGQFIEYLGGDVSQKAWADAAKELEKRFGTSWTSLASGLADRATELAALGSYSHSATELWTQIALDAWAKGSSSNSLTPVVSEENASLTNLSLKEQSINSQEVVEPFIEIENEADFSSKLQIFASVNSEQYLPLTLKELNMLEAAFYMKQLYGADNGAEALISFVGKLGLDDRPFDTSTSSEQIQKYQQNVKNTLKEDVIAKKIVNDTLGKVRGWKNPPNPFWDGVYPHSSPYEIKYFQEGDFISEAVKKSLEYAQKVKFNSTLESLLGKQLEKLVKDKAIQPFNTTILPDPIYIGARGVFLGNSEKPVETTTQNIIGEFDYFDQKKLLNYLQYFGTEESRDLAFLIGRTGGNTQWVKVNSIEFLNSPTSSNCQSILMYKANIDFYLWDGTTFDSDDWYKDELAAPFTLSLLARPLSTIFKALGDGWSLQQSGYGRPRYNVVKLQDELTGIIVNPFYEDCPPDNPPSPPGNPGNPGDKDDDKDNGSDGGSGGGLSFGKGGSLTSVIVSHDPNDILGPQGYGTERWISAKSPLDYTIRFENDPKLASAPAQVVKNHPKTRQRFRFPNLQSW
ncbi:MAG: hypothetical protein HC820_04250, partial [Hydrococcus sp. RM1_1_31]|nr:hypothetical protein [Hydrococcus sp. RM1_1_31]